MSGVSVPLVKNVPPVDALWVRKAQLGVPPNIHTTKEDLCGGDKASSGNSYKNVPENHHSKGLKNTRAPEFIPVRLRRWRVLSPRPSRVLSSTARA